MPGFNINGEGGDAPSTVEVSRAHRWHFEFKKVHELENIQLHALSCTRPSFEVATKQIHYKQTQVNLPGKYKWNPIDVVFYELMDDEVDITASKIFNYWSSGDQSLVSLSTNTLNTKFSSDADIFQEFGDGLISYQYTLKNSWPSKIEPSELNYSISDITTIKVTLVYDAANEK